MSVKSQIGVNDTPEYPKLLVNKTNGDVTLFSSDKVGTVVGNNRISKPQSARPTGFYWSSWVMDSFENFNGSITLQNA